MKEPRFDVIQRVLRSEQPVRPLLAYELRGSIVQLLAPGTTDPTWQAPPGLLANAIVKELVAAEKKDITAGAQPAGTPSTSHALVLTPVGPDLTGTCTCGRAIGRTPQRRSVDGLVGLWEQHADQTTDSTWAHTLAPSSSSIGAS